MKRVAEQPELPVALPVVLGNVDYRDFEARLRHLDAVLRESGLEDDFVARRLQAWRSTPRPARRPRPGNRRGISGCAGKPCGATWRGN